MNAGKWKTARASVIGTSHIERQTECQDYCDFRILTTSDEREILVAALADGAGSSEHSLIGAEMACTLFIKEVSRNFETGDGGMETFNRDFGIFWLEYIRQQINERAAELEKPSREFACTFLAAIVSEKESVFYQVGDGAMVCSIAEDPDTYFFAIVPEKKVYANATDFITDENAERKLLFEPLPESVIDLAIFSDGVQAVAVNYQTEMPHEPFLRPMFSPLRKTLLATDDSLNDNLANFLKSPRVNEKTDDDKTLFLASRGQKAEASANPDPEKSSTPLAKKIAGEEDGQIESPDANNTPNQTSDFTHDAIETISAGENIPETAKAESKHQITNIEEEDLGNEVTR